MPTSLDAQQAAELGALTDVYPEARELGEIFADAGHELYLVGGTIRDTLLAGGDEQRLATVDLDLATSARPDDTAALLEGWASAIWLTGAAYGTISCQRQRGDDPPRTIEITTFRSDTYEQGSRHPSVTYGDTIEADLARRDLTVNAMALKVPEATFVDPHGGLGDLHRRVLRTPIDPMVSFTDDPLRMVRLARFAAVLDAEVDPATLAAATQLAGELATVSAERIRDELVKLIAGRAPRRGVTLLVETGLSRHVLPELDVLRACVDPAHRHKDVYLHTLAVVENVMALESDGPDVVLRLAALLHDIGKPATRELHDDGRVTFHHHEVVGARMAKARLKALRYPKQVVEDVTQLVFMHLRFHGYVDGDWTDSAVRRYVNDCGRDEQLRRLNQLTRADVTTQNRAKARRLQRAMDEFEERIARLREQEELEQVRPALDGHQIMQHLGLEPGPLVGEAWSMLREARLEEGPMSAERAAELLDAWAEKKGLR